MVSKKQVKHIAHLARLKLSEKQVAKMQKELASILDYINLLKEVDVSKTKPTSSAVPLVNVMREDEPKPEKKEVVEKMLEQAPEKQDAFIKVRPVF